jgi:hypothetical protein
VHGRAKYHIRTGGRLQWAFKGGRRPPARFTVSTRAGHWIGGVILDVTASLFVVVIGAGCVNDLLPIALYGGSFRWA